MKYWLTDENGIFVKTDNDGRAVMLIKSSGFQVVLNRTALFILNIARNFSETADLLNALYEKFPNVDRRLIENDLTDLFHVMNVYGIVEFDVHSSQIAEDSDSYVTIAGEREYRVLSEFIVKECLQNENCYMQIKNETYYSPISLRYRTFNNAEYYYMVYKSGILSLVVAVTPPNANSTVYTISGIFYPNDTNLGALVDLMKMCIRRMCDEYGGRVSKIRITLQNDMDGMMKSILQDLKFTKECTLLNENMHGALSLYAFFL